MTEVHSPLYKRTEATRLEKLGSFIRSMLSQPEFQDGTKLVVGLALSAASGWYGMPYLAALI